MMCKCMHPAGGCPSREAPQLFEEESEAAILSGIPLLMSSYNKRAHGWEAQDFLLADNIWLDLHEFLKLAFTCVYLVLSRKASFFLLD